MGLLILDSLRKKRTNKAKPPTIIPSVTTEGPVLAQAMEE